MLLLHNSVSVSYSADCLRGASYRVKAVRLQVPLRRKLLLIRLQTLRGVSGIWIPFQHGPFAMSCIHTRMIPAEVKNAQAQLQDEPPLKLLKVRQTFAIFTKISTFMFCFSPGTSPTSLARPVR